MSCAWTWVVSHWDCSPRVHIQHEPQEMLKGTTTRSPGRMCVTPAPTSSTIPMGSCPSTSPASRNAPSTV